MNGIKCYWTYVPRLYRLVVLVLLPLVALVAEGLNFVIEKLPVFYMLSVVVVFYEVFADAWFLGGLHSKNYLGLQWVQSSQKGLEFSKKVVLFDCLRKYAYMAVLALADVLIIYLVSGKETIVILAEVFWYSFWMSTGVMHLMTMISRCTCNLTGSLLLSYAATGLASVLCTAVILATSYSMLWKVFLVAAPIISIGCACLLVKIGYKKMEGTYYDS